MPTCPGRPFSGVASTVLWYVMPTRDPCRMRTSPAAELIGVTAGRASSGHVLSEKDEGRKRGTRLHAENGHSLVQLLRRGFKHTIRVVAQRGKAPQNVGQTLRSHLPAAIQTSNAVFDDLPVTHTTVQSLAFIHVMYLLLMYCASQSSPFGGCGEAFIIHILCQQMRDEDHIRLHQDVRARTPA